MGMRIVMRKDYQALIREKVLERVKKEMEEVERRLRSVRHKIAVLSVKGGVGKSFVTSNLALALAEEGMRVGVFDADIHGPSIPRALGVVNNHIMSGEEGLIPAEGPMGVKVVSIGLMIPSEGAAVIWRGPLKTAYMRQVLANVNWGEVDYLLVDLPPGTGDEQLTVVQLIKGLEGILLVTMPSTLSERIVSKAGEFASKLGLEVIGVVENMSYFRCPDTGRVYHIFGKGGGERLSREVGAPLLARIPIDPRVSESMDSGEPLLLKYPESEASAEVRKVARYLIERVGD